ncbi:MAG TPA: FAD-dependent oxidoreductase [Myxococcales bacterium]|jgi:formate dehydrogenase major subunit
MAETTEIRLTIDGKACNAKTGQTILDAAKALGIEIPTLCHDPRLPPYGACLLCVVEIEKAPKLQLSCATEVREGMVIETHSSRVVASRKQTLELLASNHYADCRGECYARCPASVDVQGYLALAYAGRADDAVALVREKNPLPSVCGRVCVRYCEATCRRKTLDEPVGVNLVKRYVADAATAAPLVAKALPNGHKVAIVGGGPAGLTAAFFLAKKGYAVQILDAHPKLGGTLRYGIPDYRLPPDVLDKDIGHILDHGVKATNDVRLGQDFTLDSLKADGYQAVLLALGAVKAKPMGVKGEETAGVVGGVDYLAQVKKQGAPEMKGTVITVGGGNTAIDAARTALRCGASKSVIVYRRTREEMPADPGEIEDALAEGVTVEFLVAPLEVVSQDGHLHALRCQKMKLGDPDASGRRKPVAIEGAVTDFPCNTIVAAIGQDVDLGGTKGAKVGDVAASKWSTVQVDPKTYATNIPGVFGAGDAVSGPMAAVDAIGAGRKCALVIDHFIRTGQLLPLPTEFISKKTNLADPHPDWFAGMEKSRRAEARKDAPEDRVGSWKEMDHGIDAHQAHEESARCLSCGCSAVFTCQLKHYADEYAVDQKRLRGKVKKFKVDSRHPFIEFDPNKCVLCGKCVRLCADLLKVPALGFVHRGFDTMMRPSMERALQDTTCVSCGNCLETCPTAAIHQRSPLDKPGPWRATAFPSVCGYCGVGCALTFDKTDERIWQVTSKPPPEWDEGLLCVRGRFGHRFTCDAERLATARTGRESDQREATLAQALAAVANGLKKVRDQHGPGALAFLVSPRATNEELALVRALAHEVFGTRNLASFAALSQDRTAGALDALLGRTSSTLPLRAVEQADVVVVVNADPSEDNPVLGFHLQRAMRRGAERWSVSATETRSSSIAYERLDAKRGTSATLLNAIAGEVVRKGGLQEDYAVERTSGLREFVAGLPEDLDAVERVCGVEAAKARRLAERLADPKKSVVFVYDLDSASDRSEGDLEQIANLLLLTGRLGSERSGLVLARHYANGQGYDDLGIRPESGPERLEGAKDLAGLKAALREGRIKGLFVWGENPVADSAWARTVDAASFVVAADLVPTETTRAADVALPASAVSESDGSLTAMDRRVQDARRAFAAPAGTTGLELLARLHAQATGGSAWSLAQVREHLASMHAPYGPLKTLAPGATFFAGGERLFVERFETGDGKARFASGVPQPGPAPRRPRDYTAVEDWFQRVARKAFAAGQRTR